MKYFVDQDLLIKHAQDNHMRYIQAQPFPYIVLDNVFEDQMLNEIVGEFPSANEIDWMKFNNPNERKLASRNELQFGNKTRQFIHYLNSKPFISFLERLTGIENLIPDPSLDGGGLHQILPGGLLKIHADFNKHSKTNLDRRLNVLVYLNKNWSDEFGGHFELWSRDMSKAEVRILPLFNRMAIFSTTSTSYHGHPDPLNCPSDQSRKSIAMYYYTNGRPAHEIVEGIQKHDTLFRNRKGQNEIEVKDTVSIRTTLKKFVPPIFIEWKNLLMKRTK
jgi:Rps23 Pro-64 3,4-dihydroxylase Tpa1-like proline 4-hydroxylase